MTPSRRRKGQIRQVKGSFDFLGLPAEVQNLVYYHAFVKQESYIGSSKQRRITNSVGFKNEARRFRNLNFVKTCRKVYNEANHVFYAENGFEFYGINVLAEFLEAIGAAHRALITKMRVHCYSIVQPIPMFKKLRYLLSCLAMRSLDLYSYFTPMDHPGLWLRIAVLNAHRLFFGMDEEVLFGHSQPLGGACNSQEIQDIIANQGNRLRIRTSLQQALDCIWKHRDGKYVRFNLPPLFNGMSRHWGMRGNASALTDIGDSLGGSTPFRHRSHSPPSRYGNLIKWSCMSEYLPEEWSHPYNQFPLYCIAVTLRSKVLGRDPLLYTDQLCLAQHSNSPASVASMLRMEAGPNHDLPCDLYKSDQYYAGFIKYLTAYWSEVGTPETTSNATKLIYSPPVRTARPTYSHIGILGNHHCSPGFCQVIKRFKQRQPGASSARVLRLAVKEYDQMMRDNVVQPARILPTRNEAAPDADGWMPGN